MVRMKWRKNEQQQQKCMKLFWNIHHIYTLPLCKLHVERIILNLYECCGVAKKPLTTTQKMALLWREKKCTDTKDSNWNEGHCTGEKLPLKSAFSLCVSFFLHNILTAHTHRIKNKSWSATELFGPSRQIPSKGAHLKYDIWISAHFKRNYYPIIKHFH